MVNFFHFQQKFPYFSNYVTFYCAEICLPTAYFTSSRYILKRGFLKFGLFFPKHLAGFHCCKRPSPTFANIWSHCPWALQSATPVVTTLREGYTLPFRFRRNLTVISNYHNPAKQSFLLETLHQLINKNAVEAVENQNSLGFYNRLFLVPKPNNRWRPVLDLSTLNTFLNTVVQDGDPRDNKNLPTGSGVGHIHRLQRHILPYSNSQSVQEVYAFSPPGSVLPVQSPTLWSIHSSHGVHSGGQRGQTHGTSGGYKDPPVPRRLAGESLHPRHLSPAYTNLGNPCQELGWLVNKKSELAPKQVFNFIGYQFDLKAGKVRPTPEHWQTRSAIRRIWYARSDSSCPS